MINACYSTQRTDRISRFVEVDIASHYVKCLYLYTQRILQESAKLLAVHKVYVGTKTPNSWVSCYYRDPPEIRCRVGFSATSRFIGFSADKKRKSLYNEKLSDTIKYEKLLNFRTVSFVFPLLFFHRLFSIWTCNVLKNQHLEIQNVGQRSGNSWHRYWCNKQYIRKSKASIIIILFLYYFVHITFRDNRILSIFRKDRIFGKAKNI